MTFTVFFQPLFKSSLRGGKMKKKTRLLPIIRIALLSSILIFPISAWALDSETTQKQGAFSSHSHIQDTLTELAKSSGGQKPQACSKAGSVEKCANCGRDILNACISMVIPLCHQGDPNRAEFRHCLKDKESRCQSDYSNCAWLCKRAK